MRQQTIILDGRPVQYYLKESDRAERSRIAVNAVGNVIVTKPRHEDVITIEKFLRLKQDWVLDKLSGFKDRAVLNSDITRNDNYHYHQHRESCLSLMQQKVQSWNEIYRFDVTKIYIKQMSTRWGSCTPSGVLNFNYKVLFLPEPLQDYVAVHELCHIGHSNHSSSFWELIARALPDAAESKRQIKKY